MTLARHIRFLLSHLSSPIHYSVLICLATERQTEVLMKRFTKGQS